LRHARRLSANLIAFENGKSLQPHKFRSLGQVATLGRREGIADLRGIRMKGLVGWLAARAVHLMQVPGMSRRVGVVSNWAHSLLFAATS
jgi:NADH dehydrogenase